MERPKIVTAGVTAATALLLLSGCSSIEENNEVEFCESPSAALTPATPDPSAENYDKSTDPAWLAEKQRSQAEQTMKSDNKGWEIQLRNQVVGIGEVACEGDDGRIYLTQEGAKIRFEQID